MHQQNVKSLEWLKALNFPCMVLKHLENFIFFKIAQKYVLKEIFFQDVSRLYFSRKIKGFKPFKRNVLLMWHMQPATR